MLARGALVVVLALTGVFLVPPLGGCGRVLEPENRPVDACVRSCKAKLSRECSDHECARGCEFILDRILEKESENVLACIGRSTRRCTDVVWADCAAKIGIHADGGPPAPAPPSDED